MQSIMRGQTGDQAANINTIITLAWWLVIIPLCAPSRHSRPGIFPASLLPSSLPLPFTNNWVSLSTQPQQLLKSIQNGDLTNFLKEAFSN